MKYLILALTLTPSFSLANKPQKRDFVPILPKRVIVAKPITLPKWEKEEKKREPENTLFPKIKFSK